MPATAARFGLSNPFDPVASADAWGRYMSLMLRMFNGRIDIALAGYNSGENRAEYKAAAAQGRAINWQVLPAGVQSQTQHYVNTILANAPNWAATVRSLTGSSNVSQQTTAAAPGDDASADNTGTLLPPVGSDALASLVGLAVVGVFAYAVYDYFRG
jgi:hypothetical protein